MSNTGACYIPPLHDLERASARYTRARARRCHNIQPLAIESHTSLSHRLPFNLNVENVNGLATCTGDGENGEKVGDILRYCTEWKMGLPGGMASPMATISSFSGAGMSYQLGLFDVVKQGKNWNDLVEALVSNTPERTEEVTLVFERPTK